MLYDKINWHIAQNSVEEWRIYNISADTHPVHVHLVGFEVIGRSGFPYDDKNAPSIITIPTGSPLQAEEANLRGRKDTVRANPNEVTVIRMQFTGHCRRYMYHCHILEHEDHEMLRPFVVLPGSILAQMSGHSNLGGHMAPLSQ